MLPAPASNHPHLNVCYCIDICAYLRIWRIGRLTSALQGSPDLTSSPQPPLPDDTRRGKILSPLPPAPPPRGGPSLPDPALLLAEHLLHLLLRPRIELSETQPNPLRVLQELFAAFHHALDPGGDLSVPVTSSSGGAVDVGRGPILRSRRQGVGGSPCPAHHAAANPNPGAANESGGGRGCRGGRGPGERERGRGGEAGRHTSRRTSAERATPPGP